VQRQNRAKIAYRGNPDRTAASVIPDAFSPPQGLLGKAVGSKGNFFSACLGATIRGKGATKKNNFFGSFLAAAKKTEKLGQQKNCLPQRKSPNCRHKHIAFYIIIFLFH
jgi:hypothetical protein